MFNGDINSLIGIPYKDKGNDIDGFDCAGLVRYVTGIDTHYIPSIDMGDTKQIIKAIKDKRRYFKTLDEPKELCIVALRRLKHNHHVGVFIKGGVLHADTKGVVFSTLQNLKENGYEWEFGELING